MSEFQDLKPELYSVSDPKEMVKKAWESSTKNLVAQGYIVGMIDALRWSMSITLPEYEDLYNSYVHADRSDRTE